MNKKQNNFIWFKMHPEKWHNERWKRVNESIKIKSSPKLFPVHCQTYILSSSLSLFLFSSKICSKWSLKHSSSSHFLLFLIFFPPSLIQKLPLPFVRCLLFSFCCCIKIIFHREKLDMTWSYQTQEEDYIKKKRIQAKEMGNSGIMWYDFDVWCFEKCIRRKK